MRRIILFIMLCWVVPNKGKSQVTDLEILLSFNNTCNCYEVKMSILSGSAIDTIDRIALKSQVSIVYPTGTEYRHIESFNPSGSTFPPIIVANWFEGSYISNPTIMPGFNFLGVVHYKPTSLYDEMNPGDIIHLFNFDFGDNTVFDSEVRLFINGVDPNPTEEGMNGGNFGNVMVLGAKAYDLEEIIYDDFRVKARLYLEGAMLSYNNEIGESHGRPLMRDDLRNSSFDNMRYIPDIDPYGVLGEPIESLTKYNHVGCGKLNKFSTVENPDQLFDVEGENAIVDWVFVELRLASDSTIIVASRSGLLQRDGDIVDIDNMEGLVFSGLPSNDYFLAVHHRNHFGTMTSSAISNDELTTLVDFTIPKSFDLGVKTFSEDTGNAMIDYTGLGQNPNVILGYNCLWAGDVDANGVIEGSKINGDKLLIYNTISQFNIVNASSNNNNNYNLEYGYYQGDVNMDGLNKYVNPNDDFNYLLSSLIMYPQNESNDISFPYMIEQLPSNSNSNVNGDSSLVVKVRMYLEGATPWGYDLGETNGRPLMYDKLRNSLFTGENYIPIVDPYKVDQGGHNIVRDSLFKHVFPGNLPQFSSVLDPETIFEVTGENAIVDWVFVELRSKNDNTFVVATRSGLLQRDGDVVDVDGSEGLSFPNIPQDDYFVVVRHRNHLGIMTAAPKSTEEMALLIDFTVIETGIFDFGITTNCPLGDGEVDFTGTAVNTIQITGHVCLWAGDVNSDGFVMFYGEKSDFNASLLSILGYPRDNGTNLQANYNFAYGYLPGDVNMDSKLKATNPNDDPNHMFFSILNHPLNTSYLSNYSLLMEQLP